MRNKYRLKFTKTGPVCYLGHLDLLNVFQRSIKRAKLPIAFSNGFNPHQLMSFALPLSLGMEGLGEYLDIELSEIMNPKTIIENLNNSLPEGISVAEVSLLKEGSKNSASIIEKAVFEVKLPYKILNIDEIINKIMKDVELLIDKKTKGGIKLTNIKPDIFKLATRLEDEKTVLEMTLSAGSQRNLKANLVVEYICKVAEIEYYAPKIKYIRSELILGE